MLAVVQPLCSSTASRKREHLSALHWSLFGLPLDAAAICMQRSWADAAQVWLAEELEHSAERDKLVSAMGVQALGFGSGSL